MKYWVAFKFRLPNIARGVCDVPINNPAQADTFPTGGLWCDGRWNSPSQMSRLGSSPREREILQNVENISNQFWSHAVAKIDRHVETVWDFSLAEIAGLEDRAGLGYLGRKQPVWGGGLAAVKEGTASSSPPTSHQFSLNLRSSIFTSNLRPLLLRGSKTILGEFSCFSPTVMWTLACFFANKSEIMWSADGFKIQPD